MQIFFYIPRFTGHDEYDKSDDSIYTVEMERLILLITIPKILKLRQIAQDTVVTVPYVDDRAFCLGLVNVKNTTGG